MEAEALLWLTAVSLASASPKPASVKDNDIPVLSTPHTQVSQSIRATFVNLWVQRLGDLLPMKAFPRDTLVFLLPGNWCCEPCEVEHLVTLEDDKNGAGQFASSLELPHTHRAMKKWATNPFFEHFDLLLAQLEPKAPYVLSSFQEWLKRMDGILKDMRGLLTALFSAFFNCFCDVHKTFLDSYQKIVWEDVHSFYAHTVCDLSRTIEAKLMRIVAHVVSDNIDACNTNTTLQLFHTPVSLTASDAADYLASVVQVRLGDVVSSVALSTGFARNCPKAAASFAGTKDSREELLALVRNSISAYVEKLLTAGAEAQQRVPGFQESSGIASSEYVTPCWSKNDTSAASPGRRETTRAKVAQVSCDALRTVSIEDAVELATVSEGVDIVSRVAAVVAPLENDEESAEHLVAKRHQDMKVLSVENPGRSTQHVNCCGIIETYDSTTPDAACAHALPKRVLAVQRPSACGAEPVSSYRSNSTETRLFWNQLQRALDLDEASITQAVSLCVFPNDSPYPNVFLKDLNVCSDDQATRSFLEEIRPLLLIKGFPTMNAVSVRLFCEACAGFGRRLWEKTLEIRESLTCLPLRVSGVLLGTMYPCIRADKQFESIKQIYLQLRRVATRTDGTAQDAAILANTEVLLIKRAEILAKSVNAVECEEVEGARSLSQPTEAVPGVPPGSGSQRTLRGVVNGTVLFNKVFRDSAGYHTRKSEGPVGLNMRQTSSTGTARHHSSVSDEVAQTLKRLVKLPVREFSRGTPVADVYRQACRCLGVNPNSSLMHDLGISGADYFATLDLSSNYVGAKGLRPVLDLLHYNGEHLVSLSVCNNSLDSDDIRDLCYALLGPAGTNLVHLDLSHNPFTNSAVPFVKELVSSLTCIETLVMKGTLVFPSAARELQSILEEKTIRRFLR